MSNQAIRADHCAARPRPLGQVPACSWPLNRYTLGSNPRGDHGKLLEGRREEDNETHRRHSEREHEMKVEAKERSEKLQKLRSNPKARTREETTRNS